MHCRLFHTTKRTLRKIKVVLEYCQSAQVRSSMITVSIIREYINESEIHLTVYYDGTKY